jgi:hypothetical protein
MLRRDPAALRAAIVKSKCFQRHRGLQQIVLYFQLHRGSYVQVAVSKWLTALLSTSMLTSLAEPPADASRQLNYQNADGKRSTKRVEGLSAGRLVRLARC